jgi:tryptophan-rich sensory protein
LLWLALVGTIRQFYRVSRAAALLLCPYLLWVSFAAVLNVSIWLLNR